MTTGTHAPLCPECGELMACIDFDRTSALFACESCEIALTVDEDNDWL